MAKCANCDNDLFGGKVCYKCGLRVGGPMSVQQPTTSVTPEHQAALQFQQPSQHQPSFQQPANQAHAYQPMHYQPMPRNSTNGFAIASFICSFVIAPLGIVFGHIALSQIRKTNQGGTGLAVAGLVISYIAVAYFLFAY